MAVRGRPRWRPVRPARRVQRRRTLRSQAPVEQAGTSRNDGRLPDVCADGDDRGEHAQRIPQGQARSPGDHVCARPQVHPRQHPLRLRQDRDRPAHLGFALLHDRRRGDVWPGPEEGQ